MNTKNELIEVINAAQAKGNAVKTIRKQKFAPAYFYMSLADGKQVGPVHAEGTAEELKQKFQAAQVHLHTVKSNSGRHPRKAA